MLYPVILLVMFIELLVEVWISIRNSKELIQRGAVEIAPALLPIMALIYALKFAGSLLEYYWKSPDLPGLWLIIFVGLLLAAKGLKFWAVSSLGRYWTMRVLIVPGTDVVTKGPYRWIRHPNYAAVVMEVLAVPLIGKAFITCTVVTILISIALIFRIRAEEKALLNYTNYREKMVLRNS
jgi:methyltransferase